MLIALSQVDRILAIFCCSESGGKLTGCCFSKFVSSRPVPIVDQGKQLVSGYTNNNEVYLDIPVIVFGDHTRIVKWIDFEFAQGADGTQVLKNMKNLHAKFAYYLLLNTDIPCCTIMVLNLNKNAFLLF